MPNHRCLGFTLIELLVVITIIVVLLALLTPALDRAIYQAQLAQEAGNMDALGTTTLQYTIGASRAYPQPPQARWLSDGYQPDLIGWEQDPVRDMRTVLEGYVGDKMWASPLAPEQLDYSHEGNNTDTQVFANYYYYSGWQWIGANGGNGLLRLGDRLGFIDKTTSESIRSNVLVMPRHVTHNNGGDQVTHFDSKSVMQVDSGQGRPFGVVVVAGVGVGGATFTFSVYAGGSLNTPRGTVDMNYAYTDGSVSRMNDVELFDDRMFHAPAHAGSQHAVEFKVQIPGQR